MNYRPVLTCPYCKGQKRLGYMSKMDLYQCWDCGNSFKRSAGVSTYDERGRLPKVGDRVMPVREDDNDG